MDPTDEAAEAESSQAETSTERERAVDANGKSEKVGRDGRNRKLYEVQSIIQPSQNPFESVTLRPIGFVESVFRERNATPRQGCVIELSRAKLKLNLISADMSLEGLDEYSHIWLIFLFHQNAGGVHHKSPRVHPPRLNGETKGVFATRSPHRPNSIGLSIAKLDRIEKDTVYMSGIDLVYGTPIFDIKPYIPEFDGAPPGCRSASWIQDATPPKLPIRFSEEAEANIADLIEKKIPQFYHTVDEIRQVIVQILEIEPRSVHVKSVHEKNKGGYYGFCIDVLNVGCSYTPEEIEITFVRDWSSNYDLTAPPGSLVPTPSASSK